ncbi:39S ribosomal protein L28, mitochondrial-like isoform X2 [Dreissena polymorpha]|uniref:39S ribosomal protein L28, mitochondrial-like isoform X2 n=1 Tax=Dreissena polymorpha TaxID=45954 RepID=UPI0022644CFA|nr:39S ribosomal protein L28, mitochondrial-like isoform X2 [Dreissena polymorpha]
MPIRNHFPIFHKLKQAAYTYVWTDKCERLLPKHYKERCLNFMMKDPEAVHWIPDPRKYEYNKDGLLQKVQNHPILVKYPVQCNQGLWGGEGVVQCFTKPITGRRNRDDNMCRMPKFYAPVLTERKLYSEILDKWFEIPCTNRAMDLIDDAFGLDYYVLQLEEAEWVGLSIREALEKAEQEEESRRDTTPLKYLLADKYRQEYKEFKLQGPKPMEKKLTPSISLKDFGRAVKDYIK